MHNQTDHKYNFFARIIIIIQYFTTCMYIKGNEIYEKTKSITSVNSHIPMLVSQIIGMYIYFYDNRNSFYASQNVYKNKDQIHIKNDIVRMRSNLKKVQNMFLIDLKN